MPRSKQALEDEEEEIRPKSRSRSRSNNNNNNRSRSKSAGNASNDCNSCPKNMVHVREYCRRGKGRAAARPKRGVAPSLVRNQDRNRGLVRRSDLALARGDRDLGQRRDRALRAAKRDLAHALRGALALAAAREDRDQSALALVLRSVR